MSRLGRWLETLAGWWDGVRLPLGHARTPRWVGDDLEPVRTQPRASSLRRIPGLLLRIARALLRLAGLRLRHNVRRALAGRPSQDEIDEADYWNRLNFLELKHDEDLPEREP